MLGGFLGADDRDAFPGRYGHVQVGEQHSSGAGLVQTNLVEYHFLGHGLEELGAHDLAHLAVAIEKLEQHRGRILGALDESALRQPQIER